MPIIFTETAEIPLLALFTLKYKDLIALVQANLNQQRRMRIDRFTAKYRIIKYTEPEFLADCPQIQWNNILKKVR
jgi:hypothetical protein